jgi:hypothetical protein
LRIQEHFEGDLDSRWGLTETGSAKVLHAQGALTLSVAASSRYSNAQIDDYRTPLGMHFAWRPPLRMKVRARFEGDIRGTAGFGFWNHPFAPHEKGVRLPQSLWYFFASPPNNIALAQGVPGCGWKAATLNAKRWQFLALLPTAPLGMLLMRVPALYSRLWSIGQRAIGVSEQLLDARLMEAVHTYTLEWRGDSAAFAIDDSVVHQVPFSPHGTLGFVAWIDNQYAIVTPQGQFGFGIVQTENEQRLVLEMVHIETVE